MNADSGSELTVLEFLERMIAGKLMPSDRTHLQYPTAISRLLQFRLVAIGEGMSAIEFEGDVTRHGNQQGTIHGGMLCELADAAIGTAHSTLIGAGESFTSLDLRTSFLRPVWSAKLRAHAWAEHRGRTISHYRCDIMRDDGKIVARTDSTVMTLRGDAAQGR